MARILTRPLFRKGGLSRETGIMSGLDSPRRNYAGGGNIGGGIVRGISMGSRTGFFDPNLSQPSAVRQYLQGIFDMSKNKSGQKIVEAAKDKVKDRGFRAGQATRKGLQYLKNKLPVGMLKNLFRGVGQPLAGTIGPTASAGIGTQVAAAAAPAAAIGGLSAMNWPVYPKGHPNEGEFVSQKEAAEIFEKAGDAGTAGDIAGEAAMFDDSLPEETGGEMDAYGNYVYPTKFNWKRPEVVKVAKEQLDLLPKDKEKPDPLDKTGGEKELKGDMESDLMRAYKEYAPIFEKELGVSPEDTKKQLWMQLAKFGTGLMAQPGGDLVGAIGKAAEKPLEGAGEVVKEVSTAKRQAKLLALQTAIREGEPGQIGKAINDIAKIYNVSKKEAAGIYEKWNENKSTAQAADSASYRKYAKEQLNVNPYGFEKNIKKLLEGPDADLVGKFNKRLPMDDGVPDVDKMVDKEYYVGEDGDLYRADKSTDPPTLLQPGDDGFRDTKEKKK